MAGTRHQVAEPQATQQHVDPRQAVHHTELSLDPPSQIFTSSNTPVRILGLRIRMRNAEFGYPLAEDRVQAILAGDIAPLRFDFAKAEMETA